MESALTKGKRDRMNYLKEILQGRTANHIAPFYGFMEMKKRI